MVSTNPWWKHFVFCDLAKTFKKGSGQNNRYSISKLLCVFYVFKTTTSTWLTVEAMIEGQWQTVQWIMRPQYSPCSLISDARTHGQTVGSMMLHRGDKKSIVPKRSCEKCDIMVNTIISPGICHMNWVFYLDYWQNKIENLLWIHTWETPLIPINSHIVIYSTHLRDPFNTYQ